jgi:putative ABC transport system ATP-binding protein
VPLIQLRRVTKSFGEGVASFQALRGIDFEVQAGDFVAVMGPSGSGKSTMMNILGCLDVPTSGEFLFDGFHVETLTRDERALLRRRYLGFVFQGFNLLARTSALENVELPLLYRGEKPRPRREAAMAALAQVGLADWWDHTPAELSGGQQQRVAIARALAMQPKIMLFDEITSALDPELVGEVLGVIRDLKAAGLTMVLATHEMTFAREVATRVAFLDGGEVAELGPPEQVLSEPQQERTRRFLRRVTEAGRL